MVYAELVALHLVLPLALSACSGTVASAIPESNRRIDAANQANRKYNAWARANGKDQIIFRRLAPITYAPPTSYSANTDSYGNWRR